MIKPLFFPYTYIGKSVLDSLKHYFDKISVFQVMDQPEQISDLVDVIMPVEGDSDKLEAFLCEYHHWATLHGGKGGAFLKGQKPVPFFDSSWSSLLRDEIRKKVSNVSGDNVSGSDDSLLLARAYLKIAQDYDESMAEINSEFHECAKREKDLLSCLHGDGETENLTGDHETSGIMEDSTDAFQISKRLDAWSRVFAHAGTHSGVSGTGVFVTGSRLVIEHIVEHSPEIDYVGKTGSAGGDSGELMALLQAMSGCNWESEKSRLKDALIRGGHEKPESWLTVYIVPEVAPQVFFTKYIEGEIPCKSSGETADRIRNTVIVLVEI